MAGIVTRWSREYKNFYDAQVAPTHLTALSGRCILGVTTHHNRASFCAGDGGAPATIAICHQPCRQQLQIGDIYVSISPAKPGKVKHRFPTAMDTDERLVLSVGIVSDVMSQLTYNSVAAPEWAHTRRGDKVWKAIRSNKLIRANELIASKQKLVKTNEIRNVGEYHWLTAANTPARSHAAVGARNLTCSDVAQLPGELASITPATTAHNELAPN